MENSRMIRASILLAFGLSVGPACAATPIWQRDWTNLAPPTFARSPYSAGEDVAPRTIHFATNGDLLLSSLTYYGNFETDVLRLSTNGALRWSAKLPAANGYETPILLATVDGGALVTNDDLSWIAKLNVTGEIGWTLHVPAQRFAALTDGRVAAATCKQLTVLEPQTGEVVWQERLPFASNNCQLSGLHATPDGGQVLSIRNAYDASSGSFTLKIGSTGETIWRYAIAGDAAHLLGVDSDRVYLATETLILAVDASTGALLWQSASMSGDALLVAGDPAIPVVVAVDAATGIAPTTGAVLWNRAIAVKEVAAAVGGSLLINSTAGLMKLAADSGSTQWTTILPSTDLFGHSIDTYLALGGLDQGQFTAVARVASSSSQPAPFVQRIDFLSGQLSSYQPVPAIEQGNVGNSILVGGQIVSMRVEQDELSTKYRLSKVDASSGMELWNRIEPPGMPELMNTGGPSDFMIGASSELIAAFITEGSYPRDNAVVAAWTAGTGEPLWRIELAPPGEQWAYAESSTPVIDADSNIFLAVSAKIMCEYPALCGTERFYKLDGRDGSILWQRTQSFVSQMEPPHVNPPLFMTIDDDVILLEGYTVFRLNGANGNVEWDADTSVLDSIFSMYPAADGDIAVIGHNRRWAKLDSASGTILWSSILIAPNCSPLRPCWFQRSFQLSSGDLLHVGTISDAASGLDSPMIALLHTDGGGAYELWYPEADSPLRPLIQHVEVDANDQIWIQLRERQPESDLQIRFLTRFDIATGSLQGRQALGSYSWNAIASRFSIPQWLGAPANGAVAVQTYVSKPPSSASDGIALLDTSVTSTGNLSIDATLPPGPVMPGEIVPFQVTVHFEGSSTLDAVGVDIASPWGSGVSAAYCSAGSEVACRIETYDGDLHAEFSIEPGGSIVIGGEVAVLDSAAVVPRLNALVHGPTGLLEQDTLNNFASIPVVQSLFRNGFEAPAQR